MSELYKGSNNIGSKVGPEEGKRGPLYSNKANVRFPSFGNDTETFSEERQNLIGVFSILLDVDKRLHPDRYKFNNGIYESDHLSQSI